MTIDLSQLIRAEDKAEQALAEAQAAARAQLVRLIEAVTARFTGEVPLAEKLSWAAKEESARAIAGGAPTAEQAALITGEAAITGEDAAALVARVIVNAEAYRGVIARLTGLRRKTEGCIAAAITPDAAREVMVQLEVLLAGFTAASG